jgi:heat shock protein HtpX
MKEGNFMYCSKCGVEVREIDEYCWNCGNRIAGAVDYNKENNQKNDILNNRMEDEIDLTEFDLEDLPTTHAGVNNFYLLEFVTRMVKKENLPLLLYLILNVIIIGVISTFFFSLPIYWGMLVGLLLYIGSVSIALSPIGEWLLRRQTGCTKIEDLQVINRLEPIFSEVYYKAKQKNPSISDDVRLFINDDAAPNAFATGRKTVCVTKGLLYMSDEEIKGTLAHEFGHLSHKDVDRLLVVQVGNTVITAVCVMIQVAAVIFDILVRISSILFGGDEGIFVYIMSAISRFITVTLVSLFMKLWTMLGIALCMKTSRNNEYLADSFSTSLGYGQGLIDTLSQLGGAKPKGLFASLASSHPDNQSRIMKIREQMNGGQYYE